MIVDERYEVTKKIGFGAYGMVFAAKDSVTKEEVAIKKIETAFSNLVDSKRVLREIKILSKCNVFITKCVQNSSSMRILLN